VASTILGAIALPVGSALAVAGIGDGVDCIAQPAPCRSSSDLSGTLGAFLVVTGAVLIAAGIPMAIVGGKRLPKVGATSALVVSF